MKALGCALLCSLLPCRVHAGLHRQRSRHLRRRGRGARRRRGRAAARVFDPARLPRRARPRDAARRRRLPEPAHPHLRRAGTSCILPGIYVAEVTRGPRRRPALARAAAVPGAGEGATRSRVGEVWLTHGDVDERRHRPSSPPRAPPSAEASCSRSRRRSASAQNRACRATRRAPEPTPSAKSASSRRFQPSSPLLERHPPLARRPAHSVSGHRLFRADQSRWRTPPLFRFEDAPSGPPSIRLYQTLRSARSDLYQFEWAGAL